MTPPVPARTSRLAAVCAGASLALQAAVALLGDSAAVPGLGPATWTPPWDLGLHPSGSLVTALLAVALLTGAAAVALGLRALAAGAEPDPRRVAVLGACAVAALVVVPPLGSADHLSYAAYGRIALAGDDPYTQAPGRWRDGLDPVAGAVQPPWREEPSAYGPVATMVQEGSALLGGGSLRRTVWAWQLLAGLCFLLAGWALGRTSRTSRAGPGRVAVLWTLNPLLLGQLVLGAHLDVLAVAAACCALLVLQDPPPGPSAARDPAALPVPSAPPGPSAARDPAAPTGPSTARDPAAPPVPSAPPGPSAARDPAAPPVPSGARLLLAGALVGVAAGTKIQYALVGLALCWGVLAAPRRDALRSEGLGVLGALAVLVPAHLWSGPHTYDQLQRASRYVSLSAPWRPLVDQLDPLLGATPVRRVLGPVAWVLAVLLAALLARAVAAATTSVARGAGVPARPTRHTLTDRVVTAWFVLAAAWVLTAPYVLPWYDALLWAPMALLYPLRRRALLDSAFLLRLTVLALAYVPGRVVGMSADLERLTLGFRRHVAPWGVLVSLVAVLAWTRRVTRRA